MPKHTLSGVLLFTCVAALAMAVQYTDFNGGARAPSALSKKEQILGEMKGPVLKHTSKIRGPLESHIELLGAVPERAGDVFVLRGLVSSSKELRDVEFKWAIPAGLELVNGTVTGSISILRPGEPTEVQVTLRSLASENQQVHLLTAGADGAIKFAESAQYNTLLQGLLDQSKEELLKSTEKAAEQERERSKGLRVFH